MPLRHHPPSPSRPFSSLLSFDDPSTSITMAGPVSPGGVRRSASKKFLRPRLDENGFAVAVQEGQTVRKVGAGSAHGQGPAGTGERQEAVPPLRNLRGLGIDSSGSAARASTIFRPPSPVRKASSNPSTNAPLSPSKLDRNRSPAPSTNTLSSLRKPLSRIFRRRKSRTSLEPQPAVKIEGEKHHSPSKIRRDSHVPPPHAGTSRQGSPELRYRSIFEEEHSDPRLLAGGRIGPAPAGSGETQIHPELEKPKQVKKKSSFSALSALFRPRSQSVVIPPSSPAKARTSPTKQAYRTPEPSLPPTPLLDYAKSPSSLGQMFDLAQEEAEAAVADATPALSFYSSPMMASSRLSLAVPNQSGHTLTKSRSTPDLYGHSRTFSTAALSIKSNAHQRLGAGGPSVPSSPIVSSRLPSPVPTPLSPKFPVSPSPTTVSFPSTVQARHGGTDFGMPQPRIRSPTPPVAIPGKAALPSFSRDVHSPSLDEVTEREEPLCTERAVTLSNASSVPVVTPPSPEKQGPASLVPHAVKSYFRPSTAGTFGRPGTGNRPDTGGSQLGRPDTGRDSLRPDTAVSIGDLARATRVRLASRPRFRRISGLDLGLTDDEEEEEADDTSEVYDTRRATENMEDNAASREEDGRARKLSSGMARDDSGFTDGFGKAVEEHHSRKISSCTPLSSPSALSLFSEARRPSLPPAVSASRSQFRPTTANTIPLPNPDDSDIEKKFNPQSSLGSIARQSMVSILSDFERSWEEKMSDLDKASEDEEQRSRLESAERQERKRDPLFGSIVQKRISQIPPDVADEGDVTPVKSGQHVNEEDTPSASPIISRRFGSAAESRKIIDRESTSSSLMSRIEARRHLEDSIFMKHTLTMSRAFAVTPRGVKDVSTQTEPLVSPNGSSISGQHTPSAVIHRADLVYRADQQPLPSAGSDNTNSTYDPFAGSYFPPVRTLGIADVPASKARHSRSQSVFARLEQESAQRAGDKDRQIAQLQDALEDAHRKIEMLEYALAAH